MNNLIIPADQEEFVSDIPAGDGEKPLTFFDSVLYTYQGASWTALCGNKDILCKILACNALNGFSREKRDQKVNS